jgi:hypothetical protein
MTRKYERLGEARVEVVTTTFVASGKPEGVHDLGRLIENLNNPALSRQLELHAPVVRPLYRATSQLELDAPLLVRREDIIFINFEGPHFTRGLWKPPTIDVPALLMMPPFQVQGSVAVAQDAEITQGLRAMMQGFFVIRDARVFDAEGALLGEGEQIVINGAAIQMMSATRRHIATIGAVPTRADGAESAPADDAPARVTRAA